MLILAELAHPLRFVVRFRVEDSRLDRFGAQRAALDCSNDNALAVNRHVSVLHGKLPAVSESVLPATAHAYYPG